MLRLSMGLVPVFILAGPDMYGRLLLAPADPAYGYSWGRTALWHNRT